MFDVVCIGNALIDSFLTINEYDSSCRYNKDTGELCVKIGDKIPLNFASFQLGGNACNVSVGLARLGLQTAIVAEIGNEAFSNKIRSTLIKEAVNTSHLIIADAPSSFAVGINYKGDRTPFVHHVERHHDFTYDFETQWIYLSSMGEKWRHVYREVAAKVKRSGIKLALNPGTRQIAAGEDALDMVFEICDILFLNKEEAMRIVSHKSEIKTKDDIRSLALELQKAGPKTVVLTDGNSGSYVIDEKGSIFFQGIIDATVVERTGAGDSFAAGFMAARIRGNDIATAMQWGALNAASVIGQIGAQPGLLKRDQLVKKLHSLHI